MPAGTIRGQASTFILVTKVPRELAVTVLPLFVSQGFCGTIHVFLEHSASVTRWCARKFRPVTVVYVSTITSLGLTVMVGGTGEIAATGPALIASTTNPSAPAVAAASVMERSLVGFIRAMVRPLYRYLKVDVGEMNVIPGATDERNSPECRRI